MFKLLFFVAVVGFVLLNGGLIGTAYYNNEKVQDCFESLTRNMPEASVPEIRLKLDALFRVQYIATDDLPQGFYDALQINATGQGFEISSSYDVSIWPFGSVENRDEQGEYLPDELSGVDILRHHTRIDLRFDPYAISPQGKQ